MKSDKLPRNVEKPASVVHVRESEAFKGNYCGFLGTYV